MNEKNSAGPGNRLPAEWEKQEAVWLAWPRNLDTWGGLLSEIEKLYVKLCRDILAFEDVYILAGPGGLPVWARESLGGIHPNQCRILNTLTDDCWIRDYGGMTVFTDSGGGPFRRVINWKFNSWGGKYPPWQNDDAVARVMATSHGMERVDVDFVLEGGAVDANGKGILLTTEQCLLHKNRNPGYTQSDIEGVLHRFLGAENILWLQGGIAGDDTDGHVDNLARFGKHDTIFSAVAEDARNRNYAVLQANETLLDRYAAAHNLDLIEVPTPSEKQINGITIPASYLNFCFINGAILVPVFQDVKDERVLALFQEQFSGRKIIPVDHTRLGFGQGGIHCVSMQVAAEPQGA